MIRNCKPKLDFERQHHLRSKGGYIPVKNLGSKLKSSFFPYFSELLNTLSKNAQSLNLFEFKAFTNKKKPIKYKHFQKGIFFSNTLLTWIRVGRSDLNQHKFSMRLAQSPECLCHHREESPLHFFLDCFLYTPERQALLGLFEHYIPNFPNLSKRRKLEIILQGINTDNDDFYSTNISLTITVQHFKK